MDTLVFENIEIKVNDVFVSQWGYEQTNYCFYQIVGLHGKKSVSVRELQTNKVPTGDMRGVVTPILNDFKGDVFKKRLNVFNGKAFIKIADYEYAYKENGKREYHYTSYY